ncbi:MAG TPA: MotA/TolQ/ExbB proton channel family protein [Terracidiphilus sp.]
MLLILLQSDNAGTPTIPGAPGGAESFKALGDLFGHIGGIAIAVLVLLLLASLYSWTVILGKMGSFRRATRESRRFVRSFRKSNSLSEIATHAGDYSASPLAQVFEDVYETYRRQTGGSGPPRNLSALERTSRTSASEAVSQMERRMTWLATIGSTAPFVGLFGTVMGIVDAFHGLGEAGTATLRAVAPGISEALITTAAGLFVAVPAVVAYNQFTARIKVFASAIDDFCRELLNSLEEMAPHAPPAQRNPGPDIPREREVERGLYK